MTWWIPGVPVARPPIRKVMNDHEGKSFSSLRRKTIGRISVSAQILPTTPKLESEVNKTLEVGHR